MIKLRAPVTVIAACSCLLASCSLLPELPTSGDKAGQGAKQEDKSYLVPGSPTTVDTGPGQSNLLELLREEKERVAKLKSDVERLEQENRRLNVRLVNTEQERDKEHSGRVAAEALHKDTSEKLRDREARILNLALEKAKLEQETLLLKIGEAEKKLAEARTNAGLPRSGAGR